MHHNEATLPARGERHAYLNNFGVYAELRQSRGLFILDVSTETFLYRKCSLFFPVSDPGERIATGRKFVRVIETNGIIRVGLICIISHAVAYVQMRAGGLRCRDTANGYFEIRHSFANLVLSQNMIWEVVVFVARNDSRAF